MKPVLHPEADEELLEVVRYYAAISPELGGRFYDEITGLIREACAHPLRHQLYDPPVRRILARQFPYGVLFVAQPDRVWIVAIMHLKRRPGYWKHRLAD